jgi:hypothetical protein
MELAMSRLFSFFRKTDTDKELPLDLEVVNEEICKRFGATVSPDGFYHDWYMSVGWLLANGKSLEEIKNDWEEELKNPNMRTVDREFLELDIQIVCFMIESYLTDNWESESHKRRL